MRKTFKSPKGQSQSLHSLVSFLRFVIVSKSSLPITSFLNNVRSCVYKATKDNHNKKLQVFFFFFWVQTSKQCQLYHLYEIILVWVICTLALKFILKLILAPKVFKNGLWYPFPSKSSMAICSTRKEGNIPKYPYYSKNQPLSRKYIITYTLSYICTHLHIYKFLVALKYRPLWHNLF